MAYDLLNYAASCKVCNTVYKSNSFPIGGGRSLAPANDLKQEKQYLCYPIGKSDTDPEALITFIGTTAIPVAKSGHKRRRAEVVIDFFQLNTNDQLHKERARLIALIGGLLVQAAAGIDPVTNRTTAERFLAPHIPHVNCLRSFHRLWQKDEALARQYYATCLTLASEQPP